MSLSLRRCMLLGQPQPQPLAAAVLVEAERLAPSLQDSGPGSSWPPVLRQVFTAIFQAQDALDSDQLLAAAQQLCRLLGCSEPETAASEMAGEIRCAPVLHQPCPLGE